METSEDRLLERKRADELVYLIGAADFEKAPRMAPAVRAAQAYLRGGQWHDHADVVLAMLGASDVMAKTAESFLRKLVAHGLIAVRGSLQHTYGRNRKDTRQYRDAGWLASAVVPIELEGSE